MNILRKISFALTEAIFTVIPSVYDIFERIGSHEFFSSEAIQDVSNNIYILVSVCMLFAFGIKLINTIVNPDLMDDKKKGTGKTFINGVIAVVLISVVPFGFNALYKVQNNVIENKLIQKIVFGTDGDYKAGNLLSGYAFAAFCYPNEQVSNSNIASSGSNYYNRVVRGEIEHIGKVGDAINDKVNDEYELNYHILLSPISGGYVLYELILMCIDVAFRAVKLGILQILAPLVICAFIFSGTELLSKWFKEVISTYVLLFAKVAAITFMVYALSLLPDLFDRLGLMDDSRDTWAAKGFIRVAFLIALLQLVKKLPEIINSIFGTKLETNDGGISGRLAGMAGVGGVAQKAWDTFRKNPIHTSARVVSAPISAVGGMVAQGVAAVGQGISRGKQVAANIRDTQGGKAAGIRGFMSGFGSAVSGIATSPFGGIRAGRAGWKNGNLRSIGETGQLYEDTHPKDSTFAGRTMDRITTGLGIGSRFQRQEEADKLIDFDVNGRTRRMTFDELKSRQSFNQKFDSAQSSIRSKIEEEMNLANSNINLAPVHDSTSTTTLTGNHSQMLSKISSMRADLANYAAYGYATSQAMSDALTELETAVQTSFNSTADHVQNSIMNTGTASAYLTGGRKAGAMDELKTITDLVNDNIDLKNRIETAQGTKLGSMGGIVTFDTNFRDHARNAVTEDSKSITRAINRHDQQIEARKATARGKEIETSHTAINRNNNGNSSGGNK